MKILFLDVDGVLNSERWFIARSPLKSLPDANPIDSMWPQGHIELVKVMMLNDIVKRTDCHIVLSSSWRQMMAFTDFGNLLAGKFNFNFPDRFIGATPILGTTQVRGFEIQTWLDTEWKQNNTVIEKFVILDDDNDMAELVSHLVQTTWENGMEESHRDEVIRRLL